MRKYELVCIVHPEQDETAFAGVVEKIKGWIVENGGTVDKVDVWGRKRLAYIIRKQREGQYVLFNVSLPPAASHSHRSEFAFPGTDHPLHDYRG